MSSLTKSCPRCRACWVLDEDTKEWVSQQNDTLNLDDYWIITPFRPNRYTFHTHMSVIGRYQVDLLSRDYMERFTGFPPGEPLTKPEVLLAGDPARLLSDHWELCPRCLLGELEIDAR